MKNSTATRRWLRGATLLPLVLVAAAILSACRSSGSGSSSDSTSANAGATTGATSVSTGTATGSAVTVGLIIPIGTAGQNQPEELSAANAAAADLNQSGGIDGHQVKILLCNAGTDPNTSVACARKMVSSHVIATVRDYTLSGGDEITTTLAAASIPEIFSDPLSPIQYTSSDSYILDGGSGFEVAGMIAQVKAAGAKKVVDFTFGASVDDATRTLVARAVKNAGMSLVADQQVPITASDFSPYAAKIVSSGAQAVFMAGIETQDVGVMKAVQQAGGTKVQFYTTDLTFTPSELSGLGSLGDNLHLGSAVPPLTAAAQFPELQQFITDMNTRHATGDSNAALADQGSGSIEAWLGIEAIAKALKGSTNVSAAGLKSVLDSATGLDVGLIPPWTPSSPGPAGFARVSNTSEYFSNISNGKAVLTSPTPTDIGPFLK